MERREDRDLVSEGLRTRTGQGSGETRRTPGPEAGCNKPAVVPTEQTVEVVQNHVDGTGFREWHRETEGSDVRVEAWSGRRNEAKRRRGGVNPKRGWSRALSGAASAPLRQERVEVDAKVRRAASRCFDGVTVRCAKSSKVPVGDD